MVIFFNDYVSKDGGVVGEDGVIAAIFEELSLSCSYCIELGAGDGVKNSVTYPFRKNGSMSLLIDGAVEHKITTEGMESPSKGSSSAGSSIESIIKNKNDVKIENIKPDNINDIFDKYKVPSTPSLLSICLDDHEYHVWKALAYRPTIFVSIYNNYIRPDIKLTTPYNPRKEYRYKSKFSHATCSAMADLGIKKGYTLIEVCQYKMIFVANEFANFLTTARDYQNDWKFLYLKNIVGSNSIEPLRHLAKKDQKIALDSLRNKLLSGFNNGEKWLWDCLPNPQLHRFGDWEMITN